MSSRFLRASALALALSFTVPAHADAVLSVAGNVTSQDGSQLVNYSLAQLAALGETTIKTKVLTLQGEHQVSGVLLRQLLAGAVAKGTVIKAVALDGYAIEIPVEDIMKYDVMLATKIDGKLLSIRDKGPSWVVYPISAHPELDDPVYEARSIWQVKSLTVQ